MIYTYMEYDNNAVIDDSPAHYCGIAGIYSKEKINIPEKLFYALYSLQHRGQESCGIAYRRHERITAYKDLGMVFAVLSHYLKETHPSNAGIGHVRYSTHGGNKLENAQPIVVSCNKGEIALAHNGNLSNSEELQKKLFSEGSIFQTSTDTELILHLLARSQKDNFLDSLIEVLNMVKGAFSIVMIYNDKLIALRDPYGFRPLVMGKSDGITVFASETCALDIYGLKEVREVQPGELIIADETGTSSFFYTEPNRKAHCIFELIYFARPDSRLFGYSVHEIRKKMGNCLFAIDNNPGDLVIPVPDSGNSAAQGYSIASKLPYEQGLTRNHYTGRTFIQPTKSMREFGVKMKLHPVREAIKDKKLTVVDDSLVRGTTSKTLVKLLRDAGAGEVHLRLSSPEIKFPCYFGIDIPTREELISNRLSPEGIAEEIGADSVNFLPLSQLKKCVKNPEDFCFACFSGDYPVKILNKTLTTYKDSGVDIEKADKFVQFIKSINSKTVGKEIGAFSSGFDVDFTKYKNPVILATTDGVGTKILLARELNNYRTIGIDLVAMSVNDLLASGAEPCSFYDYIACGRLAQEQLKDIILGIVEGCKAAYCTLAGGETAELPDMYLEGDIDLAGFAVGIAEKNARLPHIDRIKAGDIIFGMPSNGIHSNGLSLARKVIPNTLKDKRQILLKPTKIYSREMSMLLKTGCILSAAHITGGGLKSNIERVIPEGLKAVLNYNWKIPEIFNAIQSLGKIDNDEMFKVFNMGIGMAVIVHHNDIPAVMKLTESNNIDLINIGQLENG